MSSGTKRRLRGLGLIAVVCAFVAVVWLAGIPATTERSQAADAVEPDSPDVGARGDEITVVPRARPDGFAFDPRRPFECRNVKYRTELLRDQGGNGDSERAVAAALDWLARHQEANGRWSLDSYQKQCQDAGCTGKASANSDVAATAFALLSFQGTGLSQHTKSPFKRNISAGLYWLYKQQKRDGNLSGTSGILMYTHGLATICLSEAFAMTGDIELGKAAQNAVQYIEKAQDPVGGGWRYNPGDPGDTSVVGWQLAALKTAELAGLKVSPQALESARKYLVSARQAERGTFAYQPAGAPTPAMTAVGLLSMQHLGTPAADADMVAGLKYLANNQPDENNKQAYYWYYATQAVHNAQGKEWDEWNQKIRKLLVDSQIKQGCALGSWDPAGHTWGDAGGRLMITALNCLTLEVYYRHWPTDKADR